MFKQVTKGVRAGIWSGSAVLVCLVASAQAQGAEAVEKPVLVAAADLPAAPDASAAANVGSAVSSSSGEADATLPDAPEVSSSLESGNALSPELQPASSLARTTPRTAGKYDTVILPGQTAARLTVHDKVIFGVKDSFSPFSAAGWVLSAAYEQVTDGSPNYGVVGNTQTGKSFAQRLGAAAARDTSETIFSESILAPVLHEDPRYYAQTNRNFFYRVIYAGTRPLITRTDGGRTTVNLSQLGGNLAGSALTQAYYPQLNRGFNEVLKTFGGSIGGSAVGDLASEFLPGLLEAVHFKKKL